MKGSDDDPRLHGSWTCGVSGRAAQIRERGLAAQNSPIIVTVSHVAPKNFGQESTRTFTRLPGRIFQDIPEGTRWKSS